MSYDKKEDLLGNQKNHNFFNNINLRKQKTTDHPDVIKIHIHGSFSNVLFSFSIRSERIREFPQ